MRQRILAGQAASPYSVRRSEYRERNRVGRFFAKTKPFRRAATRYDKLKATFAGFLQLVFAFIKARATVTTA